jgi:hypothetical protein
VFVEDGDTERESAGVILILCLKQCIAVSLLCEGGSAVEFARLMGIVVVRNQATVKSYSESTLWDQNITTRQHKILNGQDAAYRQRYQSAQ